MHQSSLQCRRTKLRYELGFIAPYNVSTYVHTHIDINLNFAVFAYPPCVRISWLCYKVLLTCNTSRLSYRETRIRDAEVDVGWRKILILLERRLRLTSSRFFILLENIVIPSSHLRRLNISIGGRQICIRFCCWNEAHSMLAVELTYEQIQNATREGKCKFVIVLRWGCTELLGLDDLGKSVQTRTLPTSELHTY